jgi:hypothetical protein
MRNVTLLATGAAMGLMLASSSAQTPRHRCAKMSVPVNGALIVRYSSIVVDGPTCARSRSVLRALARKRVREFKRCGVPYANDGACDVLGYRCDLATNKPRGRGYDGACEALRAPRSIAYHETDVSRA